MGKQPAQSCRACGLNGGRLLFTVSGNRVLRCPECSHVYLDTVHNSQSIREMYETYESGRDFYFQDFDAEVTRNIDGYLKRCREYCDVSQDKLRLLDVGCGVGVLLSKAKAQGFNCEGVEICEPLARAAEEKLNCRVHRTLLEDLHLPENGFDIITMYDLIEHLQDPAGEIKRVHRLLRPGGVLFVLTPNNDALMRRFAQWSYRLSLHQFQRPMRALYYSHHLSYFTADSLRSLLHRAGLQVMRSETRNQELSRLTLSGFEKAAVRTIFRMSERFPALGGKLLVWARK